MKKVYLYLTTLLLISSSVNAQSWSGAVSTDWNNPGNWNPNLVPGPTSDVVIPGGGITNWPVLSSNISISSINMQPGSILDVNGHTASFSAATNYVQFNGATINNSNGATDIVMNIAGSTGYFETFRYSTVNDNITINLSGTDAFYEGDVAPANHFNGNVTYNVSSNRPVYISNNTAAQYAGNLNFTRTVSGVTQAFLSGATIAGNLQMNTIGQLVLGTTAAKTAIGGDIDIHANYNSPDLFQLRRLVNQIAGGSITALNSLAPDIENDTIKASAVTITGFRGTAYASFYNNSITAPFSFASDATYSNGYGTFIRANVFTGAAQFTINGTDAFSEADGASAANIFNGPVTVNIAGTGLVQMSNGAASQFNGGLTVSRTAAGTSNLFNNGATIAGNFSYTNNSGGPSNLGADPYKTGISGTINISANYPTPNTFSMHRLVNLTGGGSVNVQNSLGVDVQKDSLVVGTASFTGYRGSASATIYNNNITGDLTLSDDASFSGGYATYVRGNTVNGNTLVTINGTNIFNEADNTGGAGHYNGNLTINTVSAAQVNLSQADATNITGNLNFTRTVAGPSTLFNGGANIGGNFSFTNNTSGSIVLGNASLKTAIGGAVNIAANFSSANTFSMRRLVNLTGGGNINVQNSVGFDIQNDTIVAAAVNITGYSGSAYGSFYNNSITANLTIADDPSYNTGYGTFIRGNIITGNTAVTINGSNPAADADIAGGANKYMGNLAYTRNGGPISIGQGAFTEVTQNFTLNSTSGISLYKIKFSGSTNSILEQLGTQALSIQELTMAKSGTGKLILNKPLTLPNTLALTGGNIQTTYTNILSMTAAATYTGGDASSHILGPVLKTGNTAFTFPVGGLGSYNPVAISAPALGTDQFSAEYFHASPNAAGYDTAQRAGTIARVSDCEYWDVRELSGGSAVTLTFSFAPPCAGTALYVTDPSKLRVAHWNGALWQDLGNGGTTGTTTGTITTAGPVSGFSPFTIATVDRIANPLPLTLLSFTAEKQKTHAGLQWTTENEQAVSYFEVQRSADSRNFETITTKQALNAAGVNTYSATDNAPLKGINFYRLKTVDLSGRSSYSRVIKLDFSGQPVIVLSPNPAKEFISVKGADYPAVIKVTDVSGRTMMTRTINSGSEMINIATLHAGTYMLQVKGNEKTQTVMFVKY